MREHSPKPGLELERLRVGMLYQQSAVTQIAGLVNAGIYVALLYGHVETPLLIAWSGLVFFIFAIRMYGQNWFRTNYLQKNEPFSPRFWENTFCVGTLLSSLTWALAATVLLPRGTIEQETFLAFLLAGTTAGAAVAYCTSWRAIQCFLLPAIVPLAIQLTVMGGSLRYGMAALLVLYVLMISTVMLRLSRYIVESVRLKFEKEHLVDELHVTQLKVMHSAKMAALGVMAAGIAHEVNNPLTTIGIESSSLRHFAETESLSRGAMISIADSIDATVFRIAKIISGLRMFARDGKQDELESVPLAQVVSETLDFCKARFRNRGISLSVDIIPPTLFLRCRRVQIGQVLLNLLNNAFDAVEGAPGAWVKIECQAEKGFVSLAVSDNGSGIKPEDQQKIMQPFFTTKEVGKGTGLGLSIAHGILQSHGGTLNLDTKSTVTRFVIRLPVENRQTPEVSA